MDAELLNILACSVCKTTPLNHVQSLEGEFLKCPECQEEYQIENDIPDMLPVKINNTLSSDRNGWLKWRAKIDDFVLWRKKTWNDSEQAHRMHSQVEDLKRRFVAFTGLRNSAKRVLDVGCGDGNIRKMLGDCSYYGVDPILIQGNYGFPFVKGIGEFLPFADVTFDTIILTQVLDHCHSIDRTVSEAIRVTGGKGTLLNVMQFVFPEETFFDRVYRTFCRMCLSIMGKKNIDSKMRQLNAVWVENFFKDRFGEITIVQDSNSQVFIKAVGWRGNLK